VTIPEAVVLVGGKGTRLRPLTLSTPKQLLPTAGVPFLAHQLARLRRFGVKHVVLATCFRAERFRACFGDGSDFGLDLEYVEEERPLDTGGGLRNAAHLLRSKPDDPVLVLNGDVLSGHDLTAQVELHEKAGADVTLHLVEVPDARSFGCVPTDAEGRVTGFHEKMRGPVTNRVNGGCYVFTRSMLSRIPPYCVVSIERETFPALVRDGATVMGYVDAAYWLDIGIPSSLVRASCDLVLGRVESTAVPDSRGDARGEALVLPNASVAGDASVLGGTTIGSRSRIGSSAQVTRSVVFDDVEVDEGAVVRDSVLSSGARVGPGVVLDDVVIGDRCVIRTGNELRGGLRLWPEVELAERSVRFSSDV
jgi:mannose-1-phosphate guanylyltransferase